MPHGTSEHFAQIVASDQQDTLTGPALDVAWVEWRGSLDLVANNDMEEGCTYTWTPAGETRRSIRQRLAAFGRRLFASMVGAHK
jgi:hypothetical protein